MEDEKAKEAIEKTRQAIEGLRNAYKKVKNSKTKKEIEDRILNLSHEIKDIVNNNSGD